MKNFKFSNLIFILIIISLVLVGYNCKDNLIGTGLADSFYPLAVGNIWEYEIIEYDSTGVVTNNGNFNDKIISSKIIDNQELYEVQSPRYSDLGCCDFDFYYQNKIGGLYLLAYTGGRLAYKNHLYKFPCSSNDFFISNYSSRTLDTIFVVSIDDTIITKAGTFSCTVYKIILYDIFKSEKPIRGYVYTYVSYGIGKIKEEAFSVNNEQQLIKNYEHNLIAYNL